MADHARLLLLAATLALAGCGERAQAPSTTTLPAGTPGPPVGAAERKRLIRLEARIERHCVALSQSLVDPAAAPSPAEQAGAFAAADELIREVRSRPRAELDVGQDLRLYLGDVVENLEGSNCDPRMIQRLEQGLDTIPR